MVDYIARIDGMLLKDCSDKQIETEWYRAVGQQLSAGVHCPPLLTEHIRQIEVELSSREHWSIPISPERQAILDRTLMTLTDANNTQAQLVSMVTGSTIAPDALNAMTVHGNALVIACKAVQLLKFTVALAERNKPNIPDHIKHVLEVIDKVGEAFKVNDAASAVRSAELESASATKN